MHKCIPQKEGGMKLTMKMKYLKIVYGLLDITKAHDFRTADRIILHPRFTYLNYVVFEKRKILQFPSPDS